jgi:hypothetical protein
LNHQARFGRLSINANEYGGPCITFEPGIEVPLRIAPFGGKNSCKTLLFGDHDKMISSFELASASWVSALLPL